MAEQDGPEESTAVDGEDPLMLAAGNEPKPVPRIVVQPAPVEIIMVRPAHIELRLERRGRRPVVEAGAVTLDDVAVAGGQDGHEGEKGRTFDRPGLRGRQRQYPLYVYARSDRVRHENDRVTAPRMAQ